MLVDFQMILWWDDEGYQSVVGCLFTLNAHHIDDDIFGACSDGVVACYGWRQIGIAFEITNGGRGVDGMLG